MLIAPVPQTHSRTSPSEFIYSATFFPVFDSILTKLNKLKKNECFEGIPKFELPPKGIQKLAFQLSNS